MTSSAQAFLPFALPEIGEEEITEVVDCLRSGWITTGPKAKRFEEDFAAFVGGGVEAVACNSATAGLHLALEAMGVGPGDKVLTTPYTFTATAEVIRYLGADPVFADIDSDTFNIDPQAAVATADHVGGIRAIMPVHFAGQSCDMDGIRAIAERLGCPVLEDAAHALPTTYKGTMIGQLSAATVFSFYANKTITTAEGGMIVTRDSQIANRVRTMRLHGINRDAFDRFVSTTPKWFYEVVAPGFKYNMPDIAAALGIHQLRKAHQFRTRRETIAKRYTEAFAALPVKVPVVRHPQDLHAWHLYVVQLDLESLRIGRDEFIEKMSAAGIGCSVHYIPLHMQPYWRDRYSLSERGFPVATAVYRRSVSLPIYTKMTDDDVQRVIDTVGTILESARC
jgi:dTDP-4-amino-4,6-dideoxygalactose transaminase